MCVRVHTFMQWDIVYVATWCIVKRYRSLLLIHVALHISSIAKNSPLVLADVFP